MKKDVTVLSSLFVLFVLSVQGSVFHINIDEVQSTKVTGPLAFTNLTLDLGGVWNLVNANGTIKTQGTVPGMVQTDLLAANIIGDPYYGYNDVNYGWIMWDNWTYSRQFELNTTFAAQKTILLVCEGIDTVSRVLVNGKVVGTTDNMFRKYEFNIAGAVQVGQNVITVAITSAPAYTQQKVTTYPYAFPYTVNLGEGNANNRNLIRKEQCSFAWDWGPCFAPQGIWKDISIVAFSDAYLDEVAPQVFPVSFPKTFYVKVDAYIIAAATQTVTLNALVGGGLSAAGSASNVQLVQGENLVTFNVSVSNPSLWYPVGYGSATLYPITISLSVAGNVVSEIVKDIGFRWVEIVQEPRENGLSFYFQVNGIAVFAKGANWIPADAFESRVTDDVIDNLLKSAVAANMNIVRNWGGGIYQHARFYDTADQLGLMVWQEFMFACGTYPRDNAFLETVAYEVQHQVRRLAHHPSIILWSGNNENEASINPPGSGWFPVANANPYLYVTDYAKLYIDTVYPALMSADTSRPFWPSSPSNGFISTDPFIGAYGNPSSSDYGDVHYYNYNDDCTDSSFFPTPRFASEYGFQSFPSIYAWLQVANQSELGINSSVVNHRQHHPDGTSEVIAMMQRFFKLPESDQLFEDYIYLSQVVQAMCIKAESEHYRRSKGDSANTMGAIYWQLNDIWQAPTWSGMEYGGRWKLLHYYAKNFFAPFLVSSYEYPADNFGVYVTSDLLQAVSGKLEIQLLDYSGKTLYTWTQPFNLSALASTLTYQNSIKTMISTGGCSARTQCFLTLGAFDPSNQLLGKNVFYLSPLANVTLPKPTISFSNFQQVSAVLISFTVVSDQIAPYTFLQTSIGGIFNDNGILLIPGVPTNITFEGWQSVSTTSLSSSLSARSIAQTYQ